MLATRPPRQRGTGSIFQLKKNGKVSPILWIKYYREGRPFRESTYTTKLLLARKILDSRLRAVRENVLIEPHNRKIQMEELYQGLIRDYEVNERASLDSAQRRWHKRLKLKFDMLAVNVRREDLDNYITWCREQGLSNATINRDWPRSSMRFISHSMPGRSRTYQGFQRTCLRRIVGRVS